VVVKRRGALIEAARVVRVGPPEPLIVEIVAELVAEGAQESPEGGDFLEDGRSHPNPKQLGCGSVVPEQFRSPAALTHSERPGGKDLNPRLGYSVELGCDVQESVARLLDESVCVALHGCFNGFGRRAEVVARRDGEYERALLNAVALSGGKEAGQEITTNEVYVTPSYFDTLQIPVLAGRTFTDADGPDAQRVVVIDQTFARKFFQEANPVGRYLDKNMMIVGVVADTVLSSAARLNAGTAPLTNKEQYSQTFGFITRVESSGA